MFMKKVQTLTEIETAMTEHYSLLPTGKFAVLCTRHLWLHPCCHILPAHNSNNIAPIYSLGKYTYYELLNNIVQHLEQTKGTRFI